MAQTDAKPNYSPEAPSHFSFEGVAKIDSNQAKSRIVLTMMLIGLVYMVICTRLAYFGFIDRNGPSIFHQADASTTTSRPDIIDRNGKLIATDITTASLFAEPRVIIDPDEALELLSTVLPELEPDATHRKLSSKAGFVWLKRELTPSQQSKILNLGIPGIGFRAETKRYYPNGETISHIAGHVNIDNVGIAGIEKHLEEKSLSNLRLAGFGGATNKKPVKLSIDIRVQHFMRDELEKAMVRYKALAAGAVILKANTGEVMAMASLPDYNPNHPVDALKEDRLNRISAGLYEMGSTFKSFTTAMALDSGKIDMKDKFNATKPLRISGHTIKDFHAKRRWLTVPEIFIYSSNIGTVKLAQKVGIGNHRNFLHRMGLLDRLKGFELPEVAKPKSPKKWRKINSATIAFGHGVLTTPLQTASGAAALLNGGKLIAPTLFPRSESEAELIAEQVIKPRTSDLMRYLFRLNVEKGSGRRAEVKGYRVGGKTGTAEKVINGKYSSKHRFNVFLAGFPIDKPEYVILVFIDEPKPEAGKKSATAGLNAAPLVRDIVRRAAPVLGVKPEFLDHKGPLFASY